MMNFKKFDPEAFLEREQRRSRRHGSADQELDTPDAPVGRETLASLASLAVPARKNEIHSFRSASVINGEYQENKNEIQAAPPAKVAKVAKQQLTNDARGDALWGDAEGERSAIIEHDGGAPHDWAEALARLDPANPPGDVPPKRWVRFIDDCGTFLDDGWASCAESLGWGPLDLFGCDRHKPYARIDHAGLLWLLNGNRLVAFTDATATIETSSGARQTYRRCPNELGRVLAWELAP